MIVDDDELVQSGLRRFLAAHGYDVATCGNGRDALLHLRSASLPQLILLDLQMPLMNGYDFRSAQLEDAELAWIPVIVISGDVDIDQTVLRASAVLRKPCSPSVLLETIQRVTG